MSSVSVENVVSGNKNRFHYYTAQPLIDVESLGISKKFKLLGHLKTTNPFRYYPEVLTKEIRHLSFPNISASNRKFIVSTHSVTNWNDRVFPHVTPIELQRLIDGLGGLTSRILPANNKKRGFYLIDDEILLATEKNTNEIIITTVYGRISKNPALARLADTSEFVPRIKLGISESDFVTFPASLPVLPVELCEYMYEHRRLLLEVYLDLKGHRHYFLRRKDSGVINLTVSSSPEKPYEKAGLRYLEAIRNSTINNSWEDWL